MIDGEAEKMLDDRMEMGFHARVAFNVRPSTIITRRAHPPLTVVCIP